jgi:deazaflavin-dependent oxidoreductase (nitroreductase family)
MPEDSNPFGRELFGREHVRVYQETGGEQGYRWRGTTILLLTTTGRVSGRERTTPLIYRNDDDSWVVIASKGGSADHPDWYKNLEVHPDATIQVKSERVPVRARTAKKEERTRLWQLMTEDWPQYDDYQRKTDREIPVVVLERRTVASG